MNYCKLCGKPLTLTPEYDMCLECQGKQHQTFTIPNNRGSVSNKTEMSKEMTPKEALEVIEDERYALPILRDFDDAVAIVRNALKEIFTIKALCDIESGKDVRMILERVLT